MTLAEFLEARISEDEAVANQVERFPHSSHAADPVGTYSRTCPSCVPFSPARVLAECASKRWIIELRVSMAYQVERSASPIVESHLITYDGVLRILALPYADHPDYDEAWRP